MKDKLILYKIRKNINSLSESEIVKEIKELSTDELKLQISKEILSHISKFYIELIYDCMKDQRYKDELIYCYLENQMKFLYFYDVSNLISRINNQKEYLPKIASILSEDFSSFYLVEILSKVKDDEELIIEVLKIFTPNDPEGYFLGNTIRYLTKRENKEFFIKKYIHNFETRRTMRHFLDNTDDDEKEDFLQEFSYDYQISIICNFKNDFLKKKYAELTKYYKSRARIIANIKDYDYIIEKIDKNIHDPNFINDLLTYIIKDEFGKKIQEYILGKNYEVPLKEYEEMVNNFKPIPTNKKTIKEIDQNITFGVELECCHKALEVFWKYTKIENFEVVKDISVRHGFEIKSPILHFTENDLARLNEVCTTLEKCDFYTDDSCGGHIHLGAAYLESVKELRSLIYLYTEVEPLLYFMSNKKNSEIRKQIIQYATQAKPKYKKEILEDEQMNSENNLVLYKANIIKATGGNRFYGLNLLNLNSRTKNTVEFRMPNGEINFNELYYNIKLFCALMQKAKELPYTESKLFNELIKTKDIFTKADIFLDMMFTDDDEKQIYQERFLKNNKINDENKLIKI